MRWSRNFFIFIFFRNWIKSFFKFTPILQRFRLKRCPCSNSRIPVSRGKIFIRIFCWNFSNFTANSYLPFNGFPIKTGCNIGIWFDFFSFWTIWIVKKVRPSSLKLFINTILTLGSPFEFTVDKEIALGSEISFFEADSNHLLNKI